MKSRKDTSRVRSPKDQESGKPWPPWQCRATLQLSTYTLLCFHPQFSYQCSRVPDPEKTYWALRETPPVDSNFTKKITGNAFNWTLGGSLLLLSHSQLKSLIVHQTLTSQNIDPWMTMLLIVIIIDIIQIQNKPSQFRSDPQLLRDQQQAPHLFCISITLESKLKFIYNANHTIITGWMSHTVLCVWNHHMH